MSTGTRTGINPQCQTGKITRYDHVLQPLIQPWMQIKTEKINRLKLLNKLWLNILFRSQIWVILESDLKNVYFEDFITLVPSLYWKKTHIHTWDLKCVLHLIYLHLNSIENWSFWSPATDSTAINKHNCVVLNDFLPTIVQKLTYRLTCD